MDGTADGKQLVQVLEKHSPASRPLLQHQILWDSAGNDTERSQWQDCYRTRFLVSWCSGETGLEMTGNCLLTWKILLRRCTPLRFVGAYAAEFIDSQSLFALCLCDPILALTPPSLYGGQECRETPRPKTAINSVAVQRLCMWKLFERDEDLCKLKAARRRKERHHF